MPTSNGAGYFLYVGDISEVYSYNVPQGQSMYFMDRNRPVFYIKTVLFNRQTVDAYDLVKQTYAEPSPAFTNAGTVQQQVPQTYTQRQQNSDADYVKRDELVSVIAETVRNEMRSQNTYKNRNKEKENN